MNALACLSALVAPLETSDFFARYYEKQPAHLRSQVPRAPLLRHEELLAALAANSGQAPGPPEGLIAFPEYVGAADVATLLAAPALLRAYLDEGHPLVWNRARGLSPAIDAHAAALAEALGAHVWPNVYATGAAGTPLDVHFDSHEVLAVQCEGHKDWTLSAVRVDRPLDCTEMESAVAAAQRGRRDEAAARPQLHFSVAPGDVVYVPRGQFHNATTPAGRSLHVTFGIRQLAGFDLVKLLAGELLADPFFREYLPPAAADPGGARAARWLAEVTARLAERLADGNLERAVSAGRAHLVRRSAPVPAPSSTPDDDGG